MGDLTRPVVRGGVALAGALLGMGLAACSPDDTDVSPVPSSSTPAGSTRPATAPPPTAAGTSVAPTGVPVAIVDGLRAPWSIAFHGDAALVSERDSGRILEFRSHGDDVGEPRVVATIEDVAPMGEGGLLGLAVHDDRLYVYFTATDGNRIESYRIDGEAGSLRLSARATVIDGLPSAGFHNGGRIAFGPDGMLYASVGDAGRSTDAQDPDTLGGKILRMTPQGGVPADNPFPGSPVYSYGHRNVQGLAWAADGTLFATEFGQNTWDELNVIEPGGNYGWPEVEGIAGDPEFTDPVQQWSPGDASPSGMTVVDGTLFIANLRGEVLRSVPTDDPAPSTTYYAGRYGRLRDAVRAPDGDLWFVTNNTDGRGSPRPGDDHVMRVHLAP